MKKIKKEAKYCGKHTHTQLQSTHKNVCDDGDFPQIFPCAQVDKHRR